MLQRQTVCGPAFTHGVEGCMVCMTVMAWGLKQNEACLYKQTRMRYLKPIVDVYCFAVQDIAAKAKESTAGVLTQAKEGISTAFQQLWGDKSTLQPAEVQVEL